MTRFHLFTRCILLSMVLIGTTSAVFSQTPDSLWVKMYGGADYDRARSMVQTEDGGFAIAGDFGSWYEAGIPTNGDIWLVRTDAAGDTLWTKTYGNQGIDQGWSLRETSDGGYIIAGVLSDIANPFSSDACLIRTDAEGNPLWIRTYQSFGQPAVSVQETEDGGFVFTGVLSTQTTFSIDLWLVRTDADGDTLWTKTYGGTGPEQAFSVHQPPGGGFLITGSTREIGTEADLWLVRTDENGDTLWTKRYNGNVSFNSVDRGYDLLFMEDEGFTVLGQAGVSVWLLRTDMNGDTLWTSKFFGTGTDFQETFDGGYIITGGSSLVRTNESGDVVWATNMNGAGRAVLETDNGDFIVAGESPLFGETDLWLYRLGAGGSLPTTAADPAVPEDFALYQNYPNPFNPATMITYSIDRSGYAELVVFNVLGQPVRRLVERPVSPGTYSIVWDGRNDAGRLLSSGTYVYRLTSGNRVQTRRMLLLK